MTENQNRILRLAMSGILLVSMFIIAREGAAYVSSGSMLSERAAEAEKERENKEGQICVVIDAGHGGSDPGKVGVNNALEKDINLQIAGMLQKFLEAEDIKVVMTREDENGLYDEGASNKKVQDMKRRLAIIEEADPVLVVSIHQNSYHEEYVKGAQVFFYQTSEKSKELAELLQEQLRFLDMENNRQAKGNDSYYLLKKTKRTIVIVECGFLSNRAEAEKLVTPYYQEILAWNIHMGVMKYINMHY